jgi:hypothetical protein
MKSNGSTRFRPPLGPGGHGNCWTKPSLRPGDRSGLWTGPFIKFSANCFSVLVFCFLVNLEDNGSIKNNQASCRPGCGYESKILLLDNLCALQHASQLIN